MSMSAPYLSIKSTRAISCSVYYSTKYQCKQFYSFRVFTCPHYFHKILLFPTPLSYLFPVSSDPFYFFHSLCPFHFPHRCSQDRLLPFPLFFPPRFRTPSQPLETLHF